MKKEESKKIIASFELTIIFLSMFAFSYMVSQTNEYFYESKSQEYSKLSLSSSIKAVWNIFKEKLKSPVIPLVSAFEQPGCCQETSEGAVCATAYEEDCTGTFVEGTACEDVSYCEIGCCEEPLTGHYTENTIKSSCEEKSGIWTKGSCQSIPGARIGCCVTGDTTHTSVTERECQLLSESFGLDTTDWRQIGEAQCVFLAEAQDMGACVDSQKNCDFTTRSQCPTSSDFYKDYLCTAPSLETNCNILTLGEVRTTCVDGKSGVYFMDSCDNPANVYDANKINDISYWSTIQDPSCNDPDGSANSATCGNCDSSLGGICSSADEDGFDVDYGQYYCQDMGCSFDYDLDGSLDSIKNGESWCMYDGKVGDGDDVVGSSHWMYQCSQGEVLPTRCDEYRNSICVDVTDAGPSQNFKMASCQPNTWRQCVSINGDVEDEDELIETCESYPGCAIEDVDIANYFHFKVCRPEFPGGFDLSTQSGAQLADSYCGAITVECEIPREPNGGLFDWSGGCDYAEDEDGNRINRECLNEDFTEKLNELCRSMGDCGATVNVAGEYSENFVVRYDFSDMGGGGNMDSESTIRSNTRHLNQDYINTLLSTANYSESQSVTLNYSEFAAGAGLLDDLAGENYETGNRSAAWYIVPGAIGGALYLTAAIAGGGLGLAGLEAGFGALSTSAGVAIGPFLGATMAAAAGFMAGLVIGNALGFNDANTLALAAGLGAVGLGLSLAIYSTAAVVPVVGWIVAGIGLLITGLSFIAGFAQDDCEPITIEYECQPYSPPIGGDDCHTCDDDPMRPCNDYKCESLGTACMIINKGEVHEECAAIPNNGVPPIITGSNLEEDDNVREISSGDSYAEIGPSSGSCFDAYETIIFGLDISEPAKCKYSTMQESYEDMDELFGVSSMLDEQQMALFIPDPSNGQSQGLNWQGDMEFYIKCEDTYGEISPEFFRYSFCVNEGDDTRAPIIERFEPEDGGLASFDIDNQTITLTTNEPAQCRWSESDVTYDAMSNQMSCGGDHPSTTWTRPFQCTTTLPTPNAENTFYIDCKDQPWLGENSEDRNSKYENEEYVLKKPEKKIEIDWIEPNEDFETGSQLESIDLKIKTSGGGTRHMCKWSMSGYKTMFDLPLGSNTGNLHTIPLNLASDTTRTIYVNCSDETGDTDSASTTFKIDRDDNPPEVTRMWQESGKLHIITDETGECRYSTETCNFDWSEATVISGNYEYIIPVVRGQRYYIKCEDEYENHPTLACSAEIMAV